ncbi:hypothetical protein HPG69_014946, partial [Diceros bicornis minor]
PAQSPRCDGAPRGPGFRHLEERVEERKPLCSPILLPTAGLELQEEARWAGVRRGRDPRRSKGAEPLERTRHWRGAMAGTSLGARFYRQIKRHPGLIPMIGFIGLGMGSAALYLLRLALRSPDVCWDRKNNPEPWNRLSPNDQYKFLAVSTDYKKLKKDRPDF